MKYLGNPIFNDERYGGNKIIKGTIFTKYKQFVENCFKILPRQALHATYLSFALPGEEDQISFEIPMPLDMNNLILNLKKHI